ncbi:hypothetical protein [Chitinophaga polysaccharea]|uniref:hypothetical protein n=1 Tax=Chitinophaga polysaccharea TaxID=1293035 RepID=UPI00115B82D6|nr:hypothetical protein [Chitinophaga polysaccharea]
MTKTANSDLDRYLELVNKYFYFEHLPPGEKKPAEYYKEGYLNVTAEKVSNMEKWEHLMEEFRQNPSIRSVRDMSHPEPHSFKAVLDINTNDIENQHAGIIVFVSFVGNHIGYYFSEGYGEKNDSDLSRPPFKPIETWIGIEKKCSYVPIISEQVKLLPKIIDIIKEQFPNFSLFNNSLADYKIPQIVVNGIFIRNLDLFQVFFSTNIHGVI